MFRKRQHMWVLSPARAKKLIPSIPPANHHHKAKESSHVMTQITDSQEIVLSYVAEDEAGQPATVTGTAAWTSSDTSVVALTQNADGTVTATSVGPLGTSTITVLLTEADGKQFTSSLALDVIGGPVTQVAIKAATATEKPVAAPAEPAVAAAVNAESVAAGAVGETAVAS